MNTYRLTKVYAYLDPRKPGKYEYKFEGGIYRPKFEPFYIGCARFQNHRRHFRYSENEKVRDRISNIRNENKIPILRILKFYKERKDALIFEKKLIIGIGRLNLNKGPLLNKVNGGPGTEGLIISQERRERIRMMNTGRKASSETKKKMSNKKKGKLHPMYGKHVSEKTKAKIKKSLVGRFAGDKNPSAKLDHRKALKIRKKYANSNISQGQLASEFGVCQSPISLILLNKLWT